MSMYIPRGAVILSRSKKAMGGVMRWGSTSWFEAPTRTNHSMWTVEEGIYPARTLYEQPIIIESDKLVRTGPLGAYHSADKLIVWQIEMTPAEIDAVCAGLLSKVGRPYGVTQLFPQLIDNRLFFGANVLRRLWKVSPLAVCSRLTGGELESKAAIRLGPPGYAQSPDDQDDALRKAEKAGGLLDLRGRFRRVTCLLDQVGDPPLKRR